MFQIPVIVWGECGQREYGAGRPEDAYLSILIVVSWRNTVP